LERELTLILPTLNERDNIVPQINAVLEAIPKIGHILIVDDHSPDGTADVVRKQLAPQLKSGKVSLLCRTSHFGLTPSLEDGVAMAQTPLVGWMDCDLSMPPKALLQMLKKISEGYEVCLGTRFAGGGAQKSLLASEKDSRVEILLSNALNLSLKFLLGLPVTDFTSGFVIARKPLLDQIVWRGHHGEYFVDFLFQAQRLGARITEIPYTCGNRIHGKSKTSGDTKALVVNCFRHAGAVLKVTCGKYTGFRALPSRQ
jgi:dolichol-phosphate mannosyltransferase